jgi:multimeric flavodoxin WrbA
VKIFSIYGSPRDDGFSSALHDVFLDSLDPGFFIEKTSVYSLAVSPCTGCGFCRDNPSCPIDDLMRPVYGGLRDSDAVVISSPVYFSSVPGQLKNVIDRCQVLWEEHIRRGVPYRKKAGFIILASGSDYGSVFKPSVTVLGHFFKSINCVLGQYDMMLVPGTDGMTGVGPELIGEVRSRAADFSGRLAASDKN